MADHIMARNRSNGRTSVKPEASAPTTKDDTPPLVKQGALYAFLEFTRPHTIVGTSLAVVVFYALCAADAARHDARLLLATWLAGLSVNLYVVGINQITDIEIDRINKPYLPLASGAMSMQTGKMIVAISGVLSLAVSAQVSNSLLATIAIIFAIGTAYSVPPLRFKRFSVLAAASITVARALVFHVGLSLSYSSVLTGKATVPASAVICIPCLLLFVIAIALLKDVPDIAGDKEHDITTFALRLGARKVMTIGRVLITVSYLSVIAATAFGFAVVHAPTLIISQAIALVTMWGLSVSCNDECPKDSYKYYMVIWKLFYFEFASFGMAAVPVNFR